LCIKLPIKITGNEAQRSARLIHLRFETLTKFLEWRHGCLLQRKNIAAAGWLTPAPQRATRVNVHFLTTLQQLLIELIHDEDTVGSVETGALAFDQVVPAAVIYPLLKYVIEEI
jgi:hypothetical protein